MPCLRHGVRTIAAPATEAECWARFRARLGDPPAFGADGHAAGLHLCRREASAIGAGSGPVVIERFRTIEVFAAAAATGVLAAQCAYRAGVHARTGRLGIRRESIGNAERQRLQYEAAAGLKQAAHFGARTFFD
jgi:hypothetical protein